MKHLPTLIVLMIAGIVAIVGIAGCTVAKPAPVPPPPVQRAEQHVAAAESYVVTASSLAGEAIGYLSNATDALADLGKVSPAPLLPQINRATTQVSAGAAAVVAIQRANAHTLDQLDQTKLALSDTSRQIERLNTEHAQAVAALNAKLLVQETRADKAERFWGYRWGKGIDTTLIVLAAVGIPMLIALLWFAVSTHNVGTVVAVARSIITKLFTKASGLAGGK